MIFDISKEYLLENYVVLNKPIHEIAIVFGCSDEIVRRRLISYDIPRRKIGSPAIGKWVDRYWLENEYRVLGKTMQQIAFENDCGETVIHKWIVKHGIESFSRSERLVGVPKSQEHLEAIRASRKLMNFSGEHNHNWKGGITRWDKKLRASKEFFAWRDAVILRDNHTCVICGCKNEVHAHHIIPFAKYPLFRFNVNNGITLCVSCHRMAHKGKVTF